MHPAIVYFSSKKLKLTQTAETCAYESYVHGTIKKIQIDPTEVIALKAIMFFDHTASQLSNVKKVKRIRNQVIFNFCVVI